MLTQHTASSSQPATLLELVCNLAKEKNEAALTELIQQGICLPIFERENNALVLLAMEGDTESVDFLIKKFKANRYYAIWGFARAGNETQVRSLKEETDDDVAQGFALNGYMVGGHEDLIDAYIAKCNTPEFEYILVWCYALVGKVEEVNRLIDDGLPPINALFAYALVGNTEEVNKLLAKYPRIHFFLSLTNSLDLAVSYYAIGGHIQEVNRLISLGASRRDASWGYLRNDCFKHRAYLLRLIALTDDEKLKQLLANNRPQKDRIKILEDSRRIHKMQASSFTLDQAQKYVSSTLSNLSTSAKIWLCQGPQLVRSGKLVADVYHHITTFVTGCSDREATIIFNDANLLLRDKAIELAQSSFFRKKKAVQDAEIRYQQRIDFSLTDKAESQMVTHKKRKKGKEKVDVDVPSCSTSIEQREEEDPRKTLRIKINKAILGKEVEWIDTSSDAVGDCYLRWMNKHGLRKIDFLRFSHLHHGKSGIKRANELLTLVNNHAASYEDILEKINEVLKYSSDTKHSLSTYLKKSFGEDELAELMQHHKRMMISP